MVSISEMVSLNREYAQDRDVLDATPENTTWDEVDYGFAPF